ncbi:retrovirus-related Pol polyprotein from transposon 17.6 [Trichonephila clavipes]|nr:retrovirus-related Pol polyprotein from transposon 17.6 [Trichonephila clavipes]
MLSDLRMFPVKLSYAPFLLNEIFVKALWDTGAEKSFISDDMNKKYFFYQTIKKSHAEVVTAQAARCVDFTRGSKIPLDFDKKSFVIPDSQIEDLPTTEFNGEWEHRPGVQNVMANVLSRNPVESIEGENIACAVIIHLVLSSRKQLIVEQRNDPELGHIYRYLENPDSSSVNATVCGNWSRDFKLVEGLLFYAKYATTLGKLRVCIPRSLRYEIMREFHDKPIAAHLVKKKTYLRVKHVCYFPYMHKSIYQYVWSCDICQKNNYKNTLLAGRLIPIVTSNPNEIVSLDLLGPYPALRPQRYRYVLVITDHFTK